MCVCLWQTLEGERERARWHRITDTLSVLPTSGMLGGIEDLFEKFPCTPRRKAPGVTEGKPEGPANDKGAPETEKSTSEQTSASDMMGSWMNSIQLPSIFGGDAAKAEAPAPEAAPSNSQPDQPKAAAAAPAAARARVAGLPFAEPVRGRRARRSPPGPEGLP